MAVRHSKGEAAADPSSCWNRAEPGEPIFVLRSHDALAPNIVRQWVRLRRYARGPKDASALDAEDIALEMERWRKVHG